ncbi:MAG: hypothetical protein AABY10_05265, partial [Nanoarchaeota archaeon]
MKKKILAISNDPGPANAMSNVINMLRKAEDLEVMVLSEGPSRDIFNNKLIPHKTLTKYGISELTPDSTQYIFDREKPNLIFTGISEFSNLERYFIYTARKNNSTSVSILDGYDYDSIGLKDSKVNPEHKFRPDYLMLVDQIVKETMLKEGFNENQLIVTGHPYYDDLMQLRQSFSLEDLSRVRSDLGIDGKDYLLTFLSQGWSNSIKSNPEEDNGYTELTVLRSLEDALNVLDIQDLCLLVKIHPREDLEVTRTAFTGKLNKVIFNKGYNTRNSILASDLVSGMFTNGLIESVYLDKDTVSLQPGLNKGDRLITNRFGLTVPVY